MREGRGRGVKGLQEAGGGYRDGGFRHSAPVVPPSSALMRRDRDSRSTRGPSCDEGQGPDLLWGRGPRNAWGSTRQG